MEAIVQAREEAGLVDPAIRINLDTKKIYQGSKRMVSRYFPPGVSFSKLLYDDEGLRYITPYRIVRRLAEEVRSFAWKCNARTDVIIDGTAGLGGDAIGFAQSPWIKRVVAVELDANRFHCLKANVSTYQLDNRVVCVEGNFLRWFRDVYRFQKTCRGSVVYLDAPWGGDGYRLLPVIRDLFLIDANGQRVPLSVVCRYILDASCPLIVLKLPANYDTETLVRMGMNVEGLREPLHSHIRHVFITLLQ